MAPTVYVLAGSDARTWHYLVPRDYDRGYPTGMKWEADGRPMTHTRGQWWSHPTLTETVVGVREGLRSVSGYRIDDQAAVSQRYPARLTVEEYRQREEGDSALEGLYSAEWEPGVLERFEFARTQFVDLGAGDPEPDDGLTWVANLPYDLEKHSEIRHLFPGKLTGFRSALAARLNQIPGVSVYTQGKFEVYAKVGYHRPIQQWQGRRLRSGGRSKVRGQTVEETVTRRESYSPPAEIPGGDRAAAVASWNAEMARWVDAITDMATARACAVCKGTGVVRPSQTDDVEAVDASEGDPF